MSGWNASIYLQLLLYFFEQTYQVRTKKGEAKLSNTQQHIKLWARRFFSSDNLQIKQAFDHLKKKAVLPLAVIFASKKNNRLSLPQRFFSFQEKKLDFRFFFFFQEELR